MVYVLVFRLIDLVELGIHCILCFGSVVQRFSFSLQCYGLWLTHVFGFVSYSDPFRIEIRRGEWNGMKWNGME